jgi:hypothetical protein
LLFVAPVLSKYIHAGAGTMELLPLPILELFEVPGGDGGAFVTWPHRE